MQKDHLTEFQHPSLVKKKYFLEEIILDEEDWESKRTSVHADMGPWEGMDHRKLQATRKYRP